MNRIGHAASSAVVLAIVGAAAHAGNIASSIAPAKFTYSVDGGATSSLAIEGTLLPSGMIKYVATVLTAEGVELTVNYAADEASDPTASAVGQFKVVNNTSASHGVEATMTFQLCPAFGGGTLFGGNVVLLVQANADGGGISCLPGADCIWQAWIGSEAVQNLYWCPFQMQTTGSGTMQSTSVFGAPIPGKIGPDSAPTIGSRNRVTITSGESLTVTSNLIVKSLGVPSGCIADLNADGVIDGNDLTLLLAQWGSVTCGVNDLNGDGQVDGLDLTLMLSSWGPCGS